MSDLNPEGLQLNLDELEEVEELVGLPASDWERASQGKLAKALVYVIKKRDDPKVKLADVGKMMMSEVEEVLRPTAAGESAAT